jgi:Phosphoglucomutase/phosphomannomutase, alpha/beta/alpha domain I/Transketolase, C-terminal domain
MEISPLAGKPADSSILIDLSKLIAAYYRGRPDPSVPAQRVAFGTSGHRGCSLDNSFNEAHILAITQAICLYRKQQGIDGPLFMGFDTHALSEPAFRSALEVLAGNGVHIEVQVLMLVGVAYWDAIGNHYGLNLEVVSHTVDPTFRFMTVDWDGQTRMDPSSPFAMARMLGLKDRFDVAFASDTDADRHGIVSHSQRLLDPNHYLSVAISYLFANRPEWSQTAAVDSNEVVEAWKVIMKQQRAPVALILTRQALPTLDRAKYGAASGLARGAYVLADPPNRNPEVLLLATGSEVALCVQAYEQLAREGIEARVVSMPCWRLSKHRIRHIEIASFRRLSKPVCLLRKDLPSAGNATWDGRAKVSACTSLAPPPR